MHVSPKDSAIYRTYYFDSATCRLGEGILVSTSTSGKQAFSHHESSRIHVSQIATEVIAGPRVPH